MSISGYFVHKELILIVQAGILISILILAVFARVSDSKASARVQRVAHKKYVYVLNIRIYIYIFVIQSMCFEL